MVIERADLEFAYSKSLKDWAKKWNEHLEKGNEYGSVKNAWISVLAEANRLSDIHYITHNSLKNELNVEIKDWQKKNYASSIQNQIKIVEQYEEEFKKVILRIFFT